MGAWRENYRPGRTQPIHRMTTIAADERGAKWVWRGPRHALGYRLTVPLERPQQKHTLGVKVGGHWRLG